MFHYGNVSISRRLTIEIFIKSQDVSISRCFILRCLNIEMFINVKAFPYRDVLISRCLYIELFQYPTSLYRPRSGELRTRKLKSHLVRTQSLNVLPLKPGGGQYKLTARDFFLAYFHPSGPFIFIFPKTSPDFSCVGCGYMVPV